MKRIATSSFLLFTFCCVSCSDLKNRKSDHQILTDEALSKVYEEVASKRFAYENSPINNFNVNGSLLTDIVKSPVLIFRFSETNCQDCVKQVAESLVKNFSKKSDKILILGSFSSDRSLMLYLKSLNLDHFKWLNVPKGSVSNYLDIENIPYLFILNQKLLIDNLFIPHYKLSNLTGIYINTISQRLK
ncbi:hypothetical protein [Roseivirga sp. UBA1976]|uniref:hypothetical protein n=1 Tax=Roseivirga sp. UBA1976 TaxID=1947386 RepID=UPI00257B5614|nr:hypothetical protein [Roseivirga sp. UBA1976]MEC7753202.1 hypothetical protein [Bacteroidota bacterium]|tara:strand:- start:1170 stop:1733 length:564 start_codon:yes stop_codon:yes gene_type:complete